MLQKLQIRNYAIIDEIDVRFAEGLNIITGETGAGKSILVGALSLILGARVESSALMNKDRKCTVEGYFATKDNEEVSNFLKQNELDVEEELVVRREITVNGKSRAFINDTPVNLNQLKGLSSILVDLHQQFDTLELGDNDFQRQVLDALAANGKLLSKYSQLFSQYRAAEQELTSLQQRQSTASATLDYNQFLFDELDEAAMKENELELLEEELKLLENAEFVKQQIAVIYSELKESEQPIVQQLRALGNKLSAVEQYHAAIGDLQKRLYSAQVELQDIADELEDVEQRVQHDPERIKEVNDRISIGYKLLKKHGVHTTRELLEIRDALQAKLDDVLNISETIERKREAVAALLRECQQLAVEISARRSKASVPFVENTNRLLMQVGMPNARLRVDIVPVELNAYGCDAINFLFDANKTNRFESLSKVASGGELSRIMLCIKSLVAQKLQLPTLIFDEIDSGISGRPQGR